MPVVLMAVLLAAVFPAAATGDGLVISEIMFNPSGNENAREYAELYNASNETVSLEGCSIGDGARFDALVPAANGSWTVSPGGFALVLDPDYFTANEPYDGIPPDVPLFIVADQAIGSRGLSNSEAEPVYLISAEGDTLSVVRYDIGCPEGYSWERILPRGEDDAGNFSRSAIAQGTPGRENSVLPPDSNPALDGSSLVISPPHPDPGETVVLLVSYRNGGLKPLSGIRIDVMLLPNLPVGSVLFSETVLPGERPSALSLTLDKPPCGYIGIMASLVSIGEAAANDTVLVELDIPLIPDALLINEVMAAPAGGKPEWIELFNAGELTVDLSAMRIRDRSGAVSTPVGVHVLVPPDGYAILSEEKTDINGAASMIVTTDRFPSLNNDGDSIVLLDRSGAVIDSMMYAKAPAGFSLERISTAPGSVEPNWDVSIDPSGATPGSLNSIYFSDIPGQEDRSRETITVTIEPNPFPEAVTISYELPFPLARVRMLVYDRRGRQVATIRDAEESGSTWSGTWDARTGGSRLPAGPYILDIEILDKRTGTIHRERKTLVVASRL